jgi:hypothetical protein
MAPFTKSPFPILVLSQWSRLIVPITAITLCCSAIAYSQIGRLSQIERKIEQTRIKAEYVREEQKMSTDLKALAKFPHSGFDNLIADWAFLNFLQYFGDDQARPKTGYKLTPSFFQIIVARDSRFLDIYPYLSAGVTLYAGRPEQTVQLLQMGIDGTPKSKQTDAYFLWQLKGTDELLFLGRNNDAQRSYRMAAAWASQSTDPQMQAIAVRSRQTAEFLASNPDSRRARVGAWSSFLSNPVDGITMHLAKQQIEALGGKVFTLPNGTLQVKLPSKD